MTTRTPPVRPAHSDELGSIRALLRACGLPHEDLTPAHLSHFLVAPGGKALRGCVGLEPRGTAALLRSLAVRPASRGGGLGARLLRAVERRARTADVRTIYLLTTTAASYFERHQYERIGRQALPEAIRQTDEAAELCPANATCMRKRLGPGTESDPSSTTSS